MVGRGSAALKPRDVLGEILCELGSGRCDDSVGLWRCWPGVSHHAMETPRLGHAEGHLDASDTIVSSES